MYISCRYIWGSCPPPPPQYQKAGYASDNTHFSTRCPPPPPQCVDTRYATAYWVCAARETPTFSPDFPFRSIIIFTNYQKIRSGASPFYIFGGFCRSGDHNFENFFNFNPFIASHGRLSPNAAFGSAAG